jgi:hypothetical protein
MGRMTVLRQSRGEGHGEGDEYQDRVKVRGMARAMTVPRQSRGEGHGEGDDDSTKTESR